MRNAVLWSDDLMSEAFKFVSEVTSFRLKRKKPSGLLWLVRNARSKSRICDVAGGCIIHSIMGNFQICEGTLSTE